MCRQRRALGLAAELAFGADLAGDPRHFRGEGVQLLDHRIDGFLELAGFRRGTSTVIFFDRSPLAIAVATSAMFRTCPGEVGSHEIDVVGQILPCAGDARDVGLAAKLAVGSDLAGDAGHFGGEALS